MTKIRFTQHCVVKETHCPACGQEIETTATRKGREHRLLFISLTLFATGILLIYASTL